NTMQDTSTVGLDKLDPLDPLSKRVLTDSLSIAERGDECTIREAATYKDSWAYRERLHDVRMAFDNLERMLGKLQDKLNEVVTRCGTPAVSSPTRQELQSRLALPLPAETRQFAEKNVKVLAVVESRETDWRALEPARLKDAKAFLFLLMSVQNYLPEMRAELGDLEEAVKEVIANRKV